MAASALSASRWDRTASEAALVEARRLREEIKDSPEPGKALYLRCVRTYKQVYYRDPHYGGCDDALFESGEVYEEMGKKFGATVYYRDAARLFRFLLKDYPTSKRCPDALLRLGDLLSGPLEDPDGGAEAYTELRKKYRSSSAAASLNSKASNPTSTPVSRTKPKAAAEHQASEVIAPSGAMPLSTQAPPTTRENAPAGPASVLNIRHWSTDDYTRVIIDMDNQARYTKTRLANPDRIYFDISNAKLSRDLLNKTFVVGDSFLKQVRAGQNRMDLVRVVLDFAAISDYSVFELYDPFRIVVDIHGANKRQAAHREQPAQAASHAEKEAPKAPLEIKAASKEAKKTEGSSHAEQAPAESMRQAGKSVTLPPSESAAVPGEAKSNEPVTKSHSNGVTKGGQTAKAEDQSKLKLADEKAAVPAASFPAVPTVDQPPASTRPEGTKTSKSSRATGAPATAESPVLPKTAAPTSHGDRTLTRMLGLKIGRIVLDPGHGGHDTGTIGRGGMLEKDLVLKVAKDLKTLLEEKVGAEVVLTRDSDRFISLEERTAIANQHSADLFLSIHANSSSNRSTSGVETYYLNFARSNADREVAARENATTVRNVSDLEDLIRKIAQAEKSSESREFASIVQRKLYGGAKQLFPMARNRGVRTAPFVVLIGANMPSVLAEVAFISNPRDEKLLKQEDNRQRIVQALFAGIEGYMRTLGSEVAQSHAGSN